MYDQTEPSCIILSINGNFAFKFYFHVILILIGCDALLPWKGTIDSKVKADGILFKRTKVIKGEVQ